MEGTEFDVFLSYNRADEAAVTHIAGRLRERGVQPWLDRWALTPGGGWQREIVQGLRASRSCAVIVGPHGLSDWAREELGVAHDRAAKDRDFRLFMVLLPGAADTNDPAWPSCESNLGRPAHRHRRPARFQNLMHAIRGVPMAPHVEVARKPSPSPKTRHSSMSREIRKAAAALTAGVASAILGVFPITAPLGVVLALTAITLGGMGVAKGRRRTRAAVGGLLTGIAGLIAGGF